MKGCDIGAKARKSKQRRVVRSQLIAAPLLLTQIGLRKIMSLVYSGDASVLERLRLAERYAVAELLKVLCLAPPISVLKLLNKVSGSELGQKLGMLAEELDFVQSVADLVSVNDQLNPSLNAVTEAFRRRQLSGKFVNGNQNIKLDALVYAESTTKTDKDLAATDIVEHYTPKVKKSLNKGGYATGLCFAYQKGECRWNNCRFSHLCSFCRSTRHGEIDCKKKKRADTDARRQRPASDHKATASGKADVPPHPRYRRDRN